jgi:hypothetical protein
VNRQSFAFAVILNLLCPGLGHAFWKDYSFGVFVFLVMLLSAVLGLVSFLLALSVWAKLALFGLPFVFFVFTFADLRRAIRTRKTTSRTSRTTAAFLIGAIVWQCLSPLAPVNFAVRNSPELFRLQDNSLSPRFHKGDLLWSNALAYRVAIFFVSRPVLYALPQHGEIVRFVDSAGHRGVGVAIGLPDEQVELSEGILMVNGMPEDVTAMFGTPVSGKVPLTEVERTSILVATIRLGSINQVYQVPVTDILGKVRRLL